MSATLTTSGALAVADAPAPPSAASPGPAQQRPQTRRSLLLIVGAAVVAGFLLRVAIGATDDAAPVDETAYLRSGLSLVDGEGFERDGQPELHFPPLVPFVLGMASKVAPSPHTATVWMTILAGTALIIPLVLLARRIAGPVAAATTAWVAALTPGLSTLIVTRGAGSEAEYVLLLVTAVWLAVTTVDHQGWPRLLRATGAGLLVGLAYLTRPEGLFVAVPLGVALVFVAARGAEDRSGALRSGFGVGAAFVVPLMVCIVPYALYLHDHTGEWQLTAKTQDASIEAWHGVASGDREARDRVLYALDDSGLDFSAGHSSLTALARDDPAGYLGIVGSNVVALGELFLWFALLPLPLWLLAAFGAWRTARTSRAVRLLLVVGALPMATALAFFVQPRYLVVTVALATVLVGAAVAGLPARLRRPAALGLIVLVAVPSLVAFRGTAGWWHPNETTDASAAGEWLNAHTDPTDLIMTRSMVVEFYAERPVLAIPYADLDEILRFARHYGAQYLVADTYTIGRVRPQLLPLSDHDQLPGLRLVHEARGEGRTARIFALDPAPPPSDEIGPSLGFMGDG